MTHPSSNIDTAQLRERWERYHERMLRPDLDGSLAGAAVLIAVSACHDIPDLLDELDRRYEALTKIEQLLSAPAVGSITDAKWLARTALGKESPA